MFLYYQDCEIIEDGKKHILVLHNCKLDMTGEVSFQAANANSAANLKVKGTVLHLANISTCISGHENKSSVRRHCMN